VVDLGGDVLPQPRHHLLLEGRQRVHHRLHPHRRLPHFPPRRRPEFLLLGRDAPIASRTPMGGFWLWVVRSAEQLEKYGIMLLYVGFARMPLCTRASLVHHPHTLFTDKMLFITYSMHKQRRGHLLGAFCPCSKSRPGLSAVGLLPVLSCSTNRGESILHLAVAPRLQVPEPTAPRLQHNSKQ
jgi:hypothetical protein